MKSGGLKEGLKNMSPKACDASTKLPTKTSVNSDATRSSVAKSHSIGPREA
jgi:hypothetical protein